jgi:hypothetical protein
MLDKLLFSALLVVAFQVPILADHYRQYLQGFYDATLEQVVYLDTLAANFGFHSAHDLIDYLVQSSDPIVQQDAKNKAQIMATKIQLEEDMRILSTGHYYAQAWYMLQPQHYPRLKQVMINFSPSIPLHPNALVWAIITALLANLIILSPLYAYKFIHKRQKLPPTPS